MTITPSRTPFEDETRSLETTDAGFLVTTSSTNTQPDHENQDTPLFPSASNRTKSDVALSADFGKLLATIEETCPEWEPNDLQAILSHQLSAPIAFDFCTTIKIWVSAEESKTWDDAKGSPKSFLDLFKHDSPSTKLLKLTKEFAKANWKHPKSALPSQISVVLYYTCIAVAFVRHGEWITGLSHSEVRLGFNWIFSQNWIDESTKAICKEAVLLLK